MTKQIKIADNIKFELKGELIYISSPSVYSFPLSLIWLLDYFSKPKSITEFNKSQSKLANPKEALKVIFELVQLGILEYSGDTNTLPENTWHNHYIHKTMLNDTYRTKQYEKAIAKCVKGKTVLDIGCGTGILSLLAAKHGAKQVIALDSNKVCCDYTLSLTQANNFEKIIKVVHSKSVDYEPNFKFDIIVSELIGYHPFDEHIISIFEDAKKRLLKEKGSLIPQNIDLYATSVFIPQDDLEKQFTKADTLRWFNNYQLDFSPLILDRFKNLKSFLIKSQNINQISDFGINSKIDSISLGSANQMIASHALSFKNKDHNCFLLSFTANLDDETMLDTRPLHQNNTNCWKYPCYPATQNTCIKLNSRLQFEIHEF
ncbi:50S ribosomal protein L11 methyltransferase [Cyclobacteriaceae bacterium]|nr:50S ribosomal protein L11 methyltransferase [Cyclobacteriaceae bacterium]